MKKQLQTRINQEEEEKNYNSLSSRVYRVCTAPSTIKELEKSIKSEVITPFGEVQVDVFFKAPNRNRDRNRVRNRQTGRRVCLPVNDDFH